MQIRVLNQFYQLVEKYCLEDNQDHLYHKPGEFAGIEGDSNDWEEITMDQLQYKIREDCKGKGTIWLYICPDNGYLCIEDPKDAKENEDLFDEYEPGLMVAID